MTCFSLRLSLLLAVPLIHSGCGTGYNEGFDCPPGIGVGCKSLSQVNDMVDHNRLPSQLDSRREQETLKINTVPQTTSQTPSGKSIKVWIPDYRDERGRVHEPHYVHDVLPIGLNLAPRILKIKKVSLPLMEV